MKISIANVSLNTKGDVDMISLLPKCQMTLLLLCAIEIVADTLDSINVLQTNRLSNGTYMVINSSNKYAIPDGASRAAQNLQFSLTRSLTYVNHPTGGQLFSSYPTAAQYLDKFFASVRPLSPTDAANRLQLGHDDYFLVYFARLQVTILYELYQYILAIYTNCLLTPVTSMREYLLYEERYGLNNKMLILSHLMSIIEEQINQAVCIRFPAISNAVASRLGPMVVRNDFGADLYQLLDSQLIKNQIAGESQKFYNERRDLYLLIFGTYLQLFDTFSRAIYQPDDQFGMLLVRLIKECNQTLQAYRPVTISGTKKPADIVQSITQIRPINPPLFLSQDETVRALTIIPTLARNIPAQVASVPWPERVVADAVARVPLKNSAGKIVDRLPRAFFVDLNGNKITNAAQASALFVHIPTGSQLYAQEIKKQPEWLNTYEGVMAMVRACVGDYAVLFSQPFAQEAILDPCVSCIVMSAGMKAGLLSSSAVEHRCRECVQVVEGAQKKAIAQADDQKNISPVLPSWTPDLPPLPVSGSV